MYVHMFLCLLSSMCVCVCCASACVHICILVLCVTVCIDYMCPCVISALLHVYV